MLRKIEAEKTRYCAEAVQGRRQEAANTYLEAEALRAFNTLNEAFVSAPIIRHFDPNRRLRVETDVSDKVIGAISTRKDDEEHWRPVAYLSRKMIPAECHYEVHDKELLAIVDSFKHWRHYLESAAHEVLVLTDHHNLKRFMETTRLSPRQVRWVQELSRYNFVIDYRPGVKNPADALSRRPDLMVTVADARYYRSCRPHYGQGKTVKRLAA